jgi:hypothetical protein
MTSSRDRGGRGSKVDQELLALKHPKSASHSGFALSVRPGMTENTGYRLTLAGTVSAAFASSIMMAW